MDSMEKIIIRNEPKYEIVLSHDSFKVWDSLDKENNGIYFYEKTEHLILTKEKINWLISTLSFLVNFLIGSVSGGIFKEKNRLKFKYNNVEKQIFFESSNLKKVKLAQNKINSRLS